MSLGIKGDPKNTIYHLPVVLKVETKDIQTQEQVEALLKKLKSVAEECFRGVDDAVLGFAFIDTEYDDVPIHWASFGSEIGGVFP